MELIVRVHEEDGYTRYICGYCGTTVAHTAPGERVSLPAYCPHCGHDTYFDEDVFARIDNNDARERS